MYTEATNPGFTNQDFYQRFRGEMRTWLGTKGGKAHKLADLLCYAPDMLHLLCRLSLDPRIPVQHKARLGATIAYFVAPADAMPELMLGPSGFADDVALGALTVSSLLGVQREIVEEHWAGDKDVVQVVQSMATVAEGVLGAGLWRTLRGKLRVH